MCLESVVKNAVIFCYEYCSVMSSSVMTYSTIFEGLMLRQQNTSYDCTIPYDPLAISISQTHYLAKNFSNYIAWRALLLTTLIKKDDVCLFLKSWKTISFVLVTVKVSTVSPSTTPSTTPSGTSTTPSGTSTTPRRNHQNFAW